jgi:Fe2+ transport system protein FeoA
MTALSFSCPLCGYAFDPATNAGCASCPLHSGCQIVCCPNCGHSTVDPRESRLARWATALLGRLGVGGAGPAATPIAGGARPLTTISAPCLVRVVGVAPEGGERAERLRAYGLAPGATIEVIQQRPVTVVRIEHTELAVEAQIAGALLVEMLR